MRQLSAITSKATSLVSCFILLCSFFTKAQFSICDADEQLKLQMQKHPEIKEQLFLLEEQIQKQQSLKTSSGTMRTGIATIPVVFHVVYNTSEQNISDEQIQSQLDVLNEDFRAVNTDITNVPSCFTSYVGDAQIQFVLAKQDPDGNASNGITRTYTNTTSFSSDGSICYTSNGGHDAWPTDQYLNVWVCNKSGAAGSSSYPWSGNTATDGIIIGYNYVGRVGTFTNNWNYQKGRTLAHEIGHWLGLGHIWGDTYCGDDLVSDTPIQEKANGGNPGFPHISACGNAPNGDMFMNYMDYTYDASRIMFTQGQIDRMNSYLETSRARLLTSQGAIDPSPSTITATIGTSNNSSNITPYGTAYLKERIQFIVTKTELEQAGYSSTYNTVNSLAFQMLSASLQSMSNFTITISHITDDCFQNSSFLSTTNATCVYFETFSTTSSEWNTHSFSTPFIYNGTDNLLIDITWSNATKSSSSTVKSTATSSYKSLVYATLSARKNINNVASGILSLSRPNIRLEFSKTQNKTSASISSESIVNPIDDYKLYPNPAQSHLTIQFNNTSDNTIAKISIYSVNGLLVNELEYECHYGEQSVSIDLTKNNLINGIYICCLNLNGYKSNKRFMVFR